jgi:pyruvate dehydrogenase complex dehydrogenase (E1) component
VRGNGKIIQELEAAFRGAGWNVIKLIWGEDWDELLARDTTGLLIRRMGEAVDGEFQTYVTRDGAYIRKNFFGKYPELLDLVSHLSDEDLFKLHRGGHDPCKVFNAFKAAMEFTGRPTVVLAHTIKGSTKPSWSTSSRASRFRFQTKPRVRHPSTGRPRTVRKWHTCTSGGGYWADMCRAAPFRRAKSKRRRSNT